MIRPQKQNTTIFFLLSLFFSDEYAVKENIAVIMSQTTEAFKPESIINSIKGRPSSLIPIVIVSTHNAASILTKFNNERLVEPALIEAKLTKADVFTHNTPTLYNGQYTIHYFFYLSTPR